MNLFETFIKKLSDRVNWNTLNGSTQLDNLVNDYKSKGSNITQEYMHDLKQDIQTELDMHTTYHADIITDIKVYSESGGKSLEDLLDYTKSRLGYEDTYVRMRDVHTELKERITASGEVPDIFEKEMLKTLELKIMEMSIFIAEPDKLWNKYLTSKEVLNRDIELLPSESDSGSGSSTEGTGEGSSTASWEQYGSRTYEGKASLYRPSQTDYYWGQGNGEELLGMRSANNTYAGTDMVATINLPGKGPIIFGELSQLSYSTYREKVPIRSLGRVTPKGYTRGYRTITGVLVFSVFDRSIVYECMKEIHESGYRMLMDEMPVFDVTITMCNEFGHKSAMTLYGISTFSEGQIMGIDSLGIKNAYEFYAIDMDPIHRLDDINILKGSSVIDKNGNIVANSSTHTEIEYYNEAYNHSLNQQTTKNIRNGFTFERA